MKLTIPSLLSLVWLFSLLLTALAHPLSSASSPSLCHGFQPGVQYLYDYNTLMLLNNHDRRGKEPVGFGFTSRFSVENVWQSNSDFILKVELKTPGGGSFITRTGERRHGIDSKKSRDKDSLPLFAHLEFTTSGENRIKGFWINNKESSSAVNVKKAIVSLIQGRPDTRNPQIKWNKVKGRLERSSQNFEVTSPNKSSEHSSILLPQVLDTWHISSELEAEHTLVTSASGWQNVTLRSKIYTEAHSHLHATFTLKLVEEGKGSQSPLSSALNVREAGKILGEEYIEESSFFLEPHKEVCHECRTLHSLAVDYEKFLSGSAAASVPAAISFLKLLDRIRIAGPGASKSDILDLLNYYKKARKDDVVSSILDVLASARTEYAILSSLEYLKLPSNTDLDTCERFLSSLAASCSIATLSSTSNDIVGHRIVGEELIRVLERDPQWKSNKLRWTTLLTLASVSKSYKRLLKLHTKGKKVDDIDLTPQVVKLIVTDLKSCGDDSECKIACLHALGNLGALSESISTLEEYALDTSGKRESISAMKAIRDCLEDHEIFSLNDSKLIYRLRILALKIVYDSNHETTSRIIAAEIIAKYLSDAVLSEQLLREVPNFGNNEMVTMMWNRALKLTTETPLNTNWLVHSTLFNGSSSAFTRNMGMSMCILSFYVC